MYTEQTELALDALLLCDSKHYLGNSFYVSVLNKTYGTVKGKLCELPKHFHHPLYNSRFSQPATYVLQHWVDGKMYVGSTGNAYVRMMAHKSNIRMKDHASEELNRLIESSDIYRFDLILIFTVTREEAYDCEQYLLDKFKGDSRLLNLAEDARAPMRGKKHSDSARQALSEFRKTDEKAISQLAGLHDSKKRKVSVYGTEYESVTLAGQIGPYSESFIRRRLNQPYDAEIFYLTDNVGHGKGKTISEEHKQKLAEFRKTNPAAIAQLESIRHLNRKKIIFNGIEYESILEASRLTGVNESLIRKWFAQSGTTNVDGTYVLNRVSRVPKKILFNGIVYDSVSLACYELNVDKAFIKNRIRSGTITYVD